MTMERRGQIKRFAKGTGLVVSSALLMWMLENRGWFDSLEGVAFDFLHGITAMGTGKNTSDEVVVVDIDDDAFKACFNGVSPLSENSVLALVRAVASYGPAVIGVDILTESSRYAQLYLGSPFGQEKDTTPVIWAAGLVKQTGESDKEAVYAASRVLGFNVKALPPGLQWAPPVFPKEGDSRVRRFPRTFRLESEPHTQTLAHRLANTYKHHEGEAEEDEELVFLTLRKKARWIAARNLMGNCTGVEHESHGVVGSTTGLGQRLPFEKENARSLLSGKIVLIGGTFQHKDDHLSSAGEISGIALNAAAVQAEISGSYLHEVPRKWLFVMDVMLGLLLLGAETIWPARTVRQKFFHICLASLGLLLLSALLMYTHVLWLSWSGLAVAMAVVFLAEVNVENPKLEEHEKGHTD